MRWDSRYDRFCLDLFSSIGSFIGSNIFVSIAVFWSIFNCDEFPFGPNFITEFLFDCIWESGKTFPVTSWISIFKFDPFGRRRIRLTLFGEFNLPRKPTIENGSKLVPVNAVSITFNTIDFRQSSRHTQGFRVSCVHSRNEWINTTKEDFFTEDTGNPFTNGFIFFFSLLMS